MKTKKINCQKNDITNMYHMFVSMSSLININSMSFNTENIITMEGLFWNCYDLENVDLNGFNKKSYYFNNMFTNTQKLTNIIYSNNFIYANNVTITNMFDGCLTNKPTNESWNGIF